MKEILPQITPAEMLEHLEKPLLTKKILRQTATIVADVEQHREKALRRYAQFFDERKRGEPLWLECRELQQAFERLDPPSRQLLQRMKNRIERFAGAQLKTLRKLRLRVPGGWVGHDIVPLQVVGCYAPGGRYPLPSSVLMTAVTARVAGVERVLVASPRPTDIVLAAAYIAGADRLLACGGAHAIAALAYGVGEARAADIVVGPGSVWVTAAKHFISARTGIDMLAGPSELVVLADEKSRVDWIAADLLAQAEHDPLARPILVASSVKIIANVRTQLRRQMQSLSTRAVARQALQNGFAIVASTARAQVAICDAIAPEHLHIVCRNARTLAANMQCYGAIFIGEQSAEVLGDFGIGPNHVLPTAGSARYRAGLSVFDFVKVRTFVKIQNTAKATAVYQDAAAMAALEGLPAHRQAALLRT